MRLKVGDRVRVREDLVAAAGPTRVLNSSAGHSVNLVSPMLKSVGDMVTIEKVDAETGVIVGSSEQGRWNWPDTAFEKFAVEYLEPLL